MMYPMYGKNVNFVVLVESKRTVPLRNDGQLRRCESMIA